MKLFIVLALTYLSVVSYAGTKSFTCRVSGSNKGCEGTVSCADGYRITAVKAACNLQRATYDEKGINAQGWNKLKVDVVGTDAKNSNCMVGDIGIAKGSVELEANLQQSISFGCRDIENKDSNGGGDCRIRGVVSCEKKANVIAPGQDIKIMSFNIYHGGDGGVSLDRIANVIAAEKADIVALQEVDNGCSRSANIKEPEYLAKKLGWKYHAFSEAHRFDGGKCPYGNAVISRLPFRVVAQIALPTGTNAPDVPGAKETRGALAVKVMPTWQSPNLDFIFVGTHFGVYRDYDTAKGKPAQALVKFVNQPEFIDMPMVLAGDLNVRAKYIVPLTAYDFTKDAVSNLLVKFTGPETFGKNQIDYILYRSRGIYKAHTWQESHVDEGASDHLPRTMLWRSK